VERKRDDPSAAVVQFRVRDGAPTTTVPAAMRRTLERALDQAIVPALGLAAIDEPVRVAGWKGGDRGRPVEELAVLQGTVTIAACTRASRPEGPRAFALLELEHMLEGAGDAQPPAAGWTARELVVDARIDGVRADAVMFAAGGHWVGVCSLGDLVVVVSGPGSPPPSALELRSVERDQLGL
jgi:hypothetical protein